MPTFYCYQRCSTCKKAEQWLVEHGVAFDKVDLVATPPAEADLLRWLTANQARGLRYFFNTSGQHYRQLGLKDQLDTMTLQQAAAINRITVKSLVVKIFRKLISPLLPSR